MIKISSTPHSHPTPWIRCTNAFYLPRAGVTPVEIHIPIMAAVGMEYLSLPFLLHGCLLVLLKQINGIPLVEQDGSQEWVDL